MRPVQKFTPEYLALCKKITPLQIAKFLDEFRQIHAVVQPSKSKLISMKVPEALLGAFKKKCELMGTPYQTQIKKIMIEWLG